jgi:hypothetical protein
MYIHIYIRKFKEIILNLIVDYYQNIYKVKYEQIIFINL